MLNRLARMMRNVVMGAVALGLVGCVKESRVEDETLYCYDWWVPLLVLLGSIILFPIGLALRSKLGSWAWTIIILSALGALLGAPSLLMEKTQVTKDGFEVRGGVWGMTSKFNVRFDDVRDIRLTQEETKTRRGGKKKNYYMECNTASSGLQKVPLGNDVRMAALPLILERAQQMKIPVIDQSSQPQ